jgi:hypothetical protein
MSLGLGVADGAEDESLKVAGCVGKVALAGKGGGMLGMYSGAQVVHLLDPLAERLGQLLVFRLHCLGHENSALSLFIGAELDPRGHGLSHLKPGVNVEELVRVSRTSYFDLINGFDSGQI